MLRLNGNDSWRFSYCGKRPESSSAFWTSSRSAAVSVCLTKSSSGAIAPALYQAATSDSNACTRSGVLLAAIEAVTFCCSSFAVYGVKSRLIVTLGATCLYWSTSVRSVPPCVPGSEPFMPCQKFSVTGGPATLAIAVAALAAAAATVGAACATAVAAGFAAAATVGAAATTVGTTAAAVAPACETAVAAAGAAVGAVGAGAVHAVSSSPSTVASRNAVIGGPPSAFQTSSGNALEEMPLHEDEQQQHGCDCEGAGSHQRVVVRPILQRERR